MENFSNDDDDVSEQVVNCQIERCGSKSEKCNPDQEFQEQLKCGMKIYKENKPNLNKLSTENQYFLKQFKNIKCLSDCELTYKLTPSYQLLYNNDESQMNVIKNFNNMLEDQKNSEINDKINSCILKQMNSENFWLDAQQGLVKLIKENEGLLKKNIQENKQENKLTINYSQFIWTLFKKNYQQGLQKCAYNVLQMKKFDQKYSQLGSCNYKCQLYQYEKSDLKQYIIEEAQRELKTIEKVWQKQGLADLNIELK